MSRYYAGFVTPRGVAELRELGILPKSEWYEDVDGIYVSHMHLDHLGALSNIPAETEAFLPHIPIYEVMEERYRASPTWLSLVPRKYYVELKELKPFETDENDVMAVPVSHSAYPAYALLYFGKDETILYTGDFRVESFLSSDEFRDMYGGEDLLGFLDENRDIRVDTLILEGTNVGSSRLPIAPLEATNISKRLALSHSPIIVTIHGLDLEYTCTLMNLAAELNLDCYIASTQTAKLIEKIELPLKPKVVEDYVDYLTTMEKLTLEETERESIFLVSYREVVDFMRELIETNIHVKDAAAIISEPEPQLEEASDYDVIANWFLKMAIESYRIRASGHYYPYQLKTILNTIKPKRSIIGIHTERPELFHSKLERSGYIHLQSDKKRKTIKKDRKK
ncbi:MAG: MBL fold metallo-hydrolase [Candidatus Jordarchaeaceae archaeon]